ncbi:MAG: type II toxin-antitoxin system VapC family toxin [Myxococcota bacterium]
MNLVLDASAGVAVAHGGDPQLSSYLERATWVGVPALYDFEATNVVWKYARLGVWTEEQCSDVLERVLGLPDARTSGRNLAAEALALARHHRHSAYDMFYVVLARRHDALLVSRDKRLVDLARTAGVKVAT